MSQGKAYWIQRAVQARAMASSAGTEVIAKIHRELADRYERLALVLDTHEIGEAIPTAELPSARCIDRREAAPPSLGSER